MNNLKNIFSGCGIAGIMIPGAKSIPENVKHCFNIMLDSIKHRGPDGYGLFCKNNILLGHRRLSILDISDRGNQPMTRDHLTITLNGEIYNFQEIRKILQNEGFSFTSATDTEVVIRSYQKWGYESVHKFNGMFAMSIWDDKKKCLFIARERLGIYPFYYYSDNNIFIFSSEIMPLLLSGFVNPDIDQSSFEHQLFATSFFETNLNRTLIKNVKTIPPGHYAYVNPDGELKITKYWDIPEQKTSSKTDEKNQIDILEDIFNDSVRLRMISDVPVSAFLSGGIDSSLINYFAYKQTKEQLTSITIKYSEGGRDPYSDSEDMDLAYSKDFINHFDKKIIHKIITVDSSKITVEDIDKIIDIASLSDDDRMLSILINYKWIRESGFKVVLNGQGADEIMGGYLGLKPFYNTIFDAKHPEVEIIHKMFPKNTIPGKKILNQNSINCADKVYKNVFEYYKVFSGSPADKVHRFLSKVQLVRILQLEDFLSMRNSIECRLPFLDYRIVEFAFEIPFSEHYVAESRTGKKMLREIALKYLPENIAIRPKQAFPESRTKQKFHQLLNIFISNKQEIIQNNIINHYFNISKFDFNESNITFSELWLILAIWRWNAKLKNLKI
jgi:asparagine synthase (glutamine-hydrolysing)